jgi:hypothetical protein
VSIVDLTAELNGGVLLSGVGAPISFNGQKVIQPGAYKNGLFVNGGQEFWASLCDLKNPWVTSAYAFFEGCYIHGEGGNITDTLFHNREVVVRGYLVDCSPDIWAGYASVGGIVENCATPFSFPGAFGFFVSCECRRAPLALFENSSIFGAGAVSVFYLKVDNVPGDAIIANGPGVLDLYAVGTGPQVGGIGLHASNGAQVHVHDNVNPTGAGGDLKVGQNQVRTWTDFRTGPPVNNEIDQTPGTGDGSRVWE